MNKNKLKENNGITLIALIITIIVMLILVAVTITVAVNGGLFEYAGRAGRETNEAIKDEQSLATLGDNLTVDQLIAKYTSVHKWTRNGDTVTCSHCNASYELGEEIPYIADTVTTPYILNAEKSGLGEASIKDNHTVAEFEYGQVDSKGNQTITQETGLKWVVLGIDDEDGDGINESLLITTLYPVCYSDSIKNHVYFYGADGYNNAVDELNNICSSLYTSNKYGKARSMTIDDVNACLNFTPVGGQYYDGTNWTTTGNLTTKLKDLRTFSSITNRGTYTPDGKNTAEALGEYVLNGYEYWHTDSLKLGMNGTDKTTKITQIEEDLIFFGNNSYWYWLASSSTSVDDVASFRFELYL